MSARNAAPTIAAQLRALMRQDYGGPWELLVVDNGSTDATADVCAEALSDGYPADLVRVEVVFLESPNGYATPRNFGIAHSIGDPIALCDADDVVGDGWLSALVGASRRYPFLASHQLTHASSGGNVEHPSLPVKFGVPVAHTGGSSFRREVYEALGGFDPSFDSGGEDVDFSLRARQLLGISPVLVPDALYYVRARTSARGAFQQGYRNGSSQVRLYRRHAESAALVPSPASVVPRRLYRLARLLPSLLDADRRRDWFLMAGVYTARLIWSLGLRVPWF